MRTKQTVLTFAICSAMTALCHGGESSGKEMKQIATQAAPSCPNWSGFYMGAFGGYTFAPTDLTLTLGGDWIYGSGTHPFDKNFIEPEVRKISTRTAVIWAVCLATISN